MNDKNGLIDQLGVWALAAVAAGVAFVMLLVVGQFGIVGAAFFAGLIFVGAGGLLAVVLLSPLPKPGEVPPAGPRVSTKPGTSGAHMAHAPEPTPAPEAAPVAAAPVTAPAEPVAEAPAPVPEPDAEASAAGNEAADKDEGTQPEALEAAREGGPDNLKEIKGVGPKLEKLCHELGIYHFDQIAGWGPAEVAWMDQNLKGFKGRVTRDDWVNQAKTLAAGGDTEFSRRVDEGDVY